MPQRHFKRKSKGSNTRNSDLEESKAEYSSEKSESDVSSYNCTVPNRIFIGGLSSNTDEWDIRTRFARYGHVKFVKIIRDNMGTSKGYGFVTFTTEQEAKNIIEKVQMTIKGRKLNIAPAVKKQKNQSDSVSTEMSSVESLQDAPLAAYPQEISRNHSKPNVFKYADNCRSIINMPYFLEPPAYIGASQLNASEDPSGTVQVNCMLPYPTFVYIPQNSYQQIAGFTYANYGSYPNLLPVVPVTMPSRSITAEKV